ncbi:MAG: Gfo/Idh/MocA family oxidoreductase [Chloroflexi bacterium]|nr:Gfo/Idh/MocA family oxidoreductase [Chloroflexota bacterium]
MQQVFFDGKGQLMVKEVPAPTVPANGGLVRVHASLISSGTELSQSTGEGSLIKKALAQPELIGRAMQLALREGVAFTARAVQDIADTWFPAGYSCAGEVIGASDTMLIGQRVAGAGAGFANHAEFNAVPSNLLAAVPDGVSYHQAAFTTVGAIAMQGVRRAEVTLGETVVVVGLGLIGQLTAQILQAAGCTVIGTDLLAERRTHAERAAGAHTAPPEDIDALVRDMTEGQGADRVILTASTRSSEPTNQAFSLCRERGRVVMVGAMGMDLERTAFYNKELDFVISRSAGPGRYDRAYEERGIDYPIGYVRWTEQRNMAAFLNLLATGRIEVDSLINATYPVQQAAAAYEAVREGALAVLLTYGHTETVKEPVTLIRQAAEPKTSDIGIALVGAGMFARSMHIPNIKANHHLMLSAVVSGSASAAQIAEKESIGLATTALHEVLDAPQVNAVLISTRHHLHAQQAVAAAHAGKHIYLEKPMALTVADCEAVLNAVEANDVLLTVGFNRRAAPTARALKAALDRISGPKTILFRVNAGTIPANHWLNDPNEGGGRLLGEGVHFIDFICGMLGAEPTSVCGHLAPDGQSFVLDMAFAGGALGSVVYAAYGDPAFPKERVEVFAGGGTAVLDDFKTLTFHNMPGDPVRSRTQDKGHAALLANFAAAIRGEADLLVTGTDGLRATRIALQAAHNASLD